MSTQWNTVQKKSQHTNQKRSFNSNQNKRTTFDPNFKSKSTIIRDNIIEIIKKNTQKNVQNWKKICINLLDEINNTDSTKDKSLIVNNIMKLSLHEIIDNKEILKLVDTLYKSGKHAFIHFALWPNKDVNKLYEGFERSQDDIFETVKILLEKSKFNILEQNEKNETVIKSLFEAEKCGFITKDNCDRLYDYFMKPTEKATLKMTKEIFNKLTKSNFQNMSSTLCWLLSLESCQLDIELFEKFKLVKTFDRDPKTGKYGELVKISGYLENLNSNGPIAPGNDFDRYFKSNPWTGNIIKNICSNISIHFLKCNPEDLPNKEIWGGAIGEFATYDDIYQFCNDHKDDYPEAVMTCVAHAYPRYKCTKLIDFLHYLVENKKAKVKYNSEMIISGFTANTIFSTSTSTHTNSSDELDTLIEKINISSINDLTECPKLNDKTIYPEELDDVAYSIVKDYIGKWKLEMIMEVLIIKFISQINKPNGLKSIGILLEYLFQNDHIDHEGFYSVYDHKINEIKELWCEENPKGINKVCKAIELKRKN